MDTRGQREVLLVSVDEWVFNWQPRDFQRGRWVVSLVEWWHTRPATNLSVVLQMFGRRSRGQARHIIPGPVRPRRNSNPEFCQAWTCPGVTFYIPLLPVPFQLENIHPKTLQIGDCGSGQPVGHKYSSPRSKKSPRPVRKRIEAWAQKLFMPALCLRILPIVFFASTFQFQRFPVIFSQSPPEQITCSRLLFVHGN